MVKRANQNRRPRQNSQEEETHRQTTDIPPKIRSTPPNQTNTTGPHPTEKTKRTPKHRQTTDVDDRRHLKNQEPKNAAKKPPNCPTSPQWSHPPKNPKNSPAGPQSAEKTKTTPEHTDKRQTSLRLRKQALIALALNA